MKRGNCQIHFQLFRLTIEVPSCKIPIMFWQFSDKNHNCKNTIFSNRIIHVQQILYEIHLRTSDLYNILTYWNISPSHLGRRFPFILFLRHSSGSGEQNIFKFYQPIKIKKTWKWPFENAKTVLRRHCSSTWCAPSSMLKNFMSNSGKDVIFASSFFQKMFNEFCNFCGDNVKNQEYIKIYSIKKLYPNVLWN